MERTIQHQFDFDQSPAMVWEHLTNSALLAQWLMPNDFMAIPGHKFQFKTKPLPAFGFDGIIQCEVLELRPNEKLVYSWKSGVLDTTVSWTLTPKGNGTTLTLEHKGFKGFKNLLAYIAMNSGWKKIGKRLHGQLNLS